MHSKHTSYRADIDGLRAVAVLLVLLFHFDLGVSGGFVGVDVFFVISGYLITEVIRNAIHAKRFSFSDFYIRRLLRLQPALIVTIGLCLGAGYLLMDPASFSGLATSAEYSILSGSNFYFWLNQGYFDASAQTQPLLHTWSLATEWQFYLIWPFIVWAALKLSDRFLLILLSLMTFGSLAASQIMLDYDPSAAYFMMPFRVFELSIGGILVFATKHRASPSVESATVIAGLLMIIGSAFLLDSTSPFPGLRALIPCLGAAACIYAGRSKSGKVLALKPIVLVGLISYSVYLVHWPINVFYSYFVVRDLYTYEKLAMLAASLAIGFIMYATIEKIFISKRKTVLYTGLSSVALTTIAVIWTSTNIITEQGIKSRIPTEYSKFSENPTDFHRLNYGGQGFKLNTDLGDQDGEIIGIFIGDSFAHQYSFGIDNRLKNSNKKVEGIFRHGCIYSSKYKRFFGGSSNKTCESIMPELSQKIEGNSYPVIYAQHWDGYRNGLSDIHGNQIKPASNEEYQSIMIDIIKTMRESIGPNRELIIIGSQPYPKAKFAVATCLLRPRFVKQACDEMLSYSLERSGPVDTNIAIKKYVEHLENTTFLDPADDLCKSDLCTIMSKEEILYSDSMHLSKDGGLRATDRIIGSLSKQN